MLLVATLFLNHPKNSAAYYIAPCKLHQRPVRLLSNHDPFTRMRGKTRYAKTKRSESDDMPMIMQEVQSSRRFRQSGVLLGGTVLSLALFLGITAKIFDPVPVLIVTTTIIAYFISNTLNYNETSPPLPDSFFEVRKSEIPNSGNGLFARKEIAKGTYLMDYVGEVLSEGEYFQRYPTGQGRYVACISESIPFPDFGKLSEPTYIDGIDASQSNLARYMNSKRIEEGANVFWKKQRFGNRAMHFYAAQDVTAGDELCFDYGSNYWDAIIQIEEE